jgi:hypothetical protein
MPEGYGLPDTTDGVLARSAVQERLVAAQRCWLASVRPDGRPHTVPRWGVWLDGRCWWSSDDGGGLRVLVPQRALAWSAFPTGCTRSTSG